ncbi:MAG: hypothetical protein GY810_17965 [Aureispira sp.]|nr:hypothetical protein [Aureispira sp.]
MKFYYTLILLVFGIFPVLAQPALSEGNVRIGTQGTHWSKLPSSKDIRDAEQAFKDKYRGRIAAMGSPAKMHGPWYDDPLMANKVFLTVRFKEEKPNWYTTRVFSLTYDYSSGKFSFEGVLIHTRRDKQSKKMETATYLIPVDLRYYNNGWIDGGSPTPDPPSPDPYEQPTPTPGYNDDYSDDEDDLPWGVIFGTLGGLLVAGIIARMRKKEKGDAKAPKTDEKGAPKKKKERVKYILEISREHILLTPDKAEAVRVKAWKISAKGKREAPNATIRLSCADPAVEIKPKRGKGELQVAIKLVGTPLQENVPIEVTAKAGQKSTQATIHVKVKAGYTISLTATPKDKHSLLPNSEDTLSIHAQVLDQTGKVDLALSQKVTYGSVDDWLDVSATQWNKKGQTVHVQASNPRPHEGEITPPKSVAVYAQLEEPPHKLTEVYTIHLEDYSLEVDRDYITIPATQTNYSTSLSAWVEGENDQKWKFKAVYKNPHGGRTKKLSTISTKQVAPNQIDITLEGPSKLPKKGDKSVSETLIVSAQKGHEDPIERHITICVHQEGLFLERGMNSKGAIEVVADGSIDKGLEFASYLWDAAQEDIVVDRVGLEQLTFELDPSSRKAENVLSVLKPQITFDTLVGNVPFGRYKLKSEKEIPGENELFKAKYTIKAPAPNPRFPEAYQLEVPFHFRSHGVGSDVPGWDEAYNRCRRIIIMHIPTAHAIKELSALLERRKKTLGVEGMVAMHKTLWSIAQDLILAKGAEGYERYGDWAEGIEYTLEWAEWAGVLCFNAWMVALIGPYAPVASIVKGEMVEAIKFFIYEEDKTVEDFLWDELERNFFGLFRAAEGRVIDPDRISKMLKVNKAYAWMIFVTYHFLVNLYRTKSLKEATYAALREARDEIIVTFLVGKITKDAHKHGYKVDAQSPRVKKLLDDVSSSVKKDSAGREYVPKDKVIELMKDPAKVRTLKNKAPDSLKKAFERTRHGMQKAHDADLIKHISENSKFSEGEIKIDDFRTPGTKGEFNLNTDRDYRVLVRGGKTADGRDIWLEYPKEKWQNKSFEYFGKHTNKPAGYSDAEWAEKLQQMPTDKAHIEASLDYSDQGVDLKTGKRIRVEPNIMKVKAGKAKLLDPEGLGNMYKEKVDASLRGGNVPEAYAQGKKGVDSLKKVRKGYEKMGYEVGELPKNLEKAMDVVNKAPVDVDATPEAIKNINNKLNKLGFKDVGDVSTAIQKQFKNFSNVKPKSVFGKLLNKVGI